MVMILLYCGRSLLFKAIGERRRLQTGGGPRARGTPQDAQPLNDNATTSHLLYFNPAFSCPAVATSKMRSCIPSTNFTATPPSSSLFRPTFSPMKVSGSKIPTYTTFITSLSLRILSTQGLLPLNLLLQGSM